MGFRDSSRALVVRFFGQRVISVRAIGERRNEQDSDSSTLEGFDSNSNPCRPPSCRRGITTLESQFRRTGIHPFPEFQRAVPALFEQTISVSAPRDDLNMSKSQKFRMVEWSNDFCVLRFKTSQPAGEELEFRYLLPFRKPITRSKRAVRGKVPDYSNEGMQHSESFNEVKALWVLVASAHADVLKVQPFQLVYKNGGKVVHYVPDILLAWGREMWAVEIREDWKADLPEEATRFAAIGELLETQGIHFLVWVKSAICEQPRLRIAFDLLEYQSCEVPQLERERIRRVFTEQITIRLRNLTDEDTCRVLSLVVSGLLYIDWWQHQLSMDTVVSVSPIGRQEWPNDRSADAQRRARGKQ
jgi:hypothetical protein